MYKSFFTLKEVIGYVAWVCFVLFVCAVLVAIFARRAPAMARGPDHSVTLVQGSIGSQVLCSERAETLEDFICQMI